MRKGFTLIEILVVMAILSAIFPIIFVMYSSGSKIFDFGMIKANFFQEYRRTMNLLRKDIMESGWNVDITSNKKILRLAKFSKDSNGLPLYDSDGYLECRDYVIYSFSRNAFDGRGILSRNGKPILSGLSDLSFRLNRQIISKVQIPCVEVKIVNAFSKDRLTPFVSIIVPRHMASWAQHPFWISITNGQRVKYHF